MSEPLVSFRDPAGSLVITGAWVRRLIWDAGIADFEAFLNTSCARNEIAAGRIVGTRLLGKTEVERTIRAIGDARHERRKSLAAVAEHDRIPFPSYPYEWPPQMLHAAGRLTLELASSFGSEGMGLKDATPFNVQFLNPKPVFVDVLSFERRNPTDFVWLAEGQFIRTFILPLLAHKYFGIHPHTIFLSHRDGLEPGDVYKMAGPLRRIAPPFLGSVSLPTWLAAGAAAADYTKKRQARSAEQAIFILSSVFRRLDRKLGRVRPPDHPRSHWARYMQEHSYDASDFAAKEQFIRETLDMARPLRVLDVGCNTGHFSAMAANAGAHVVAIDLDPDVVGAVWHRANEEDLSILPLVQNLTRPSPAVGWNYSEGISFLDRARKDFDAVFMLAVLHHMMVTDGVSLEDIIALIADISNDVAVIEFVAPGDPMFMHISRGRNDLYADLDVDTFEAAAKTRFEITGKLPLGNPHRVLYRLQLRK